MELNKQLPVSLRESKVAYSGSRINVNTIKINNHTKEAVIHPGAALILPIVDDDNIIMIKNYRFVVDETLWELPAGILEPDEPPIETAKRELIEETGYRAKSIEPLTTFYTTPGICDEIMHAYVAKDLEFVGQNLDEFEEIEVVIVSWTKVKGMINHGEIMDGKSLLALLYYLSKMPISSA